MPDEPHPIAPAVKPARPVELWTVLPATAESLRVVRGMLSEWLSALRWPDEACLDMLLAVNEAITNIVAHAYPADRPERVQLYAWEAIDQPRRQRSIVAVVIDSGRWKPAAVPEPTAPRVRGLIAMSRCMDSVHIEPTPRGTTVVMTSRPAA